MGLIQEFKEFAIKGNVVDLAVGVVIGGAFGKITNSLVNDILMPPLGLLISGINFKDIAIPLKPAVTDASGKVIAAAVGIQIGNLIQVLIEFTDNGRGIASQDHKRVFELFRRAGRTDRPGEGVESRALQSAARSPVSAASCEPRISSAAAWEKPLSTGEVTRLSNQPKRAIPITICSSPDSRAIHAARATHCALPGSARPVSEAPISRLVSAVGPTPSRVEELNSTATSAGIRDA